MTHMGHTTKTKTSAVGVGKGSYELNGCLVTISQYYRLPRAPGLAPRYGKDYKISVYYGK